MSNNNLTSEISKAIKEGIADAYEVYNERYLSAKELCNQFQMFTPSWLKNYGHLLPRERQTAIAKDGRVVGTRYGYPQHRIARMIADGSINDISHC